MYKWPISNVDFNNNNKKQSLRFLRLNKKIHLNLEEFALVPGTRMSGVSANVLIITSDFFVAWWGDIDPTP